MLNSLATKLALRKAGLSNVNFSLPSFPSGSSDSKSKSGGDGGGGAASFLPPLPPINLPTVTVPKAFQSWQSSPPPSAKLREKPLTVGEKAPWNVKLRVPDTDGRGSVVVFLRFCGCPCRS
jgi:hypothetical protein